MSMLAIGTTDVGKRREGNEDSLLVDNEVGVYAVCDGMGGHAGGEIASATAIEVIANHVKEHRAVIERVRDGEQSVDPATAVVAEAIREAAARIYQLARSRREFAGMGTTATVLVDLGSKAVMGHVGDSRLYLLRGTAVHQLSTDHTMVEELVKSGVMTPEDARGSPWGHALTRAVGNQPAVQVDTLVFDVFPGDRLLLCTDGLTEHFSAPTEISTALSGELEEIPDVLVAVANQRGGDDNITAVCVHVDADQDVGVALAAQSVMRLDTLDRSFLMNGLSLAQAQRVLNACEVRAVVAGETLVAEGDECSSLYMVLQGMLALSRGGNMVGTVSAGDTIGETTLLRTRPARAALTAAEDAVVLCLPRLRFDELVHRRPWLGIELMDRVARRVCAAEDRVRATLVRAGVDEPQTLRVGDLF